MIRRRVGFFFSSRRRHTRCSRDWSSDVCSSDLHWFALYLMAMGRADDSIAAMQRALTLDPLFPIVPTNLGRAYAFARRYPEAVAHYRLALEMDPRFLPAQFELARVLGLQGELGEARAVCRAARAAAPESEIGRAHV